MIDSTSFTSEPQYQRPDNRASDIDFVPKEPLVITPPPTRTGTFFDYDIMFPKRLYDKLGREMLVCNRIDCYGNAIILGSFCYAITFITWGFYRCKVVKVNDTFLWSVILLFGGIGEVTAGFLEYCKGRVWPMALYLTFGFFCLSDYGLYVIPEWFGITYNMSMLYNYTAESLCAFFAGWTIIIFGLVMAAGSTNVYFLLQLVAILMGTVLRCVGEGTGSLVTKRHVNGIFMVISGFFSLFVCISQILNNETFYRPVFPSFPMRNPNEMDLPTGVPTAPVVPVAPVAPVVPVAPGTPVAVV